MVEGEGGEGGLLGIIFGGGPRGGHPHLGSGSGVLWGRYLRTWAGGRLFTVINLGYMLYLPFPTVRWGLAPIFFLFPFCQIKSNGDLSSHPLALPARPCHLNPPPPQRFSFASSCTPSNT